MEVLSERLDGWMGLLRLAAFGPMGRVLRKGVKAHVELYWPDAYPLTEEHFYKQQWARLNKSQMGLY